MFVYARTIWGIKKVHFLLCTLLVLMNPSFTKGEYRWILIGL